MTQIQAYPANILIEHLLPYHLTKVYNRQLSPHHRRNSTLSHSGYVTICTDIGHCARVSSQECCGYEIGRAYGCGVNKQLLANAGLFSRKDLSHRS